MVDDSKRPLNEAQIRAALERANKATEGEWTTSRVDLQSYNMDGYPIVMVYRPGCTVGEIIRVEGDKCRDDAEFISAARRDVPDLAVALLDLREKARALALADEEIGAHIAVCGECIPEAGAFCETADAINRRWEQVRKDVLEIVLEVVGGEPQ